jgi:hypothetical protein
MNRDLGSAWGAPVSTDGATITHENGHAHIVAETLSEQPTMRVASTVLTIDAVEEKVSITPTRKQKAKAAPQPWVVRNLHVIIIACLAIVQTGLLVISYLPSSITLQLGWTSGNGPFPTSTAPVVTALFYMLPFVSGFLARRWDLALLGSTLPAWFAIAVYSIGAATHNGIFYFLQNNEPTYLIGTVELFAGLGFFGWLAWRFVRGNAAA